jgi:hypothetical protein
MKIWKPISKEVNVRETIEISEYGDVRKIVDGKPIEYASGVNSRGYPHIGLHNTEGVRKFYTIHRLVALTFLPDQKNECINHIDGNRLNNHYSNLEWVTRKQNSVHATDIVGYVRGRKLSDEQVIELLYDYLENNMTFEQLTDKWETTRETIRNIVNRRAKKLLTEHEYEILRKKHLAVKEKKYNGRNIKKDRV